MKSAHTYKITYQLFCFFISHSKSKLIIVSQIFQRIFPEEGTENEK